MIASTFGKMLSFFKHVFLYIFYSLIRFLEDSGISLEAFSSPVVQRSNTVILVKNLPAKTTAQELCEIFTHYGELGRVVLPPSGMSGKKLPVLNSKLWRHAFSNLLMVTVGQLRGKLQASVY